MPRGHPRTDAEHLNFSQARALVREVNGSGVVRGEVFKLAQGLCCVDLFPVNGPRTSIGRLRCQLDWKLWMENNGGNKLPF